MDAAVANDPDQGRRTAERQTRWVNIALIAVGTAGVIALAVPTLVRFIPGCAFYEITGWYCPGCGSGRMVRALLRGDFGLALAMNPFALVLMVPAGYELARQTLKGFGRPAPPAVFDRPWVAWAVAAAVIAFWILRNVPIWPFSWLAPGL